MEMYVCDRISDQRTWYAAKAEANKRASLMWFILVVLAQLFTIISGIVAACWMDLGLSLAPVFAAFTATFMAWQSINRFDGLARSYAMASHELGLMDAKASHIKNETELSHFVLDAEEAMSREHVLWLAKRHSL
ncbi:SLATT domain-containing protein [bacterium]|nr:SLATT domain-containing protein [bacterium]